MSRAASAEQSVCAQELQAQMICSYAGRLSLVAKELKTIVTHHDEDMN